MEHFVVFLCFSPLATSPWSVFNSLSQVPARPSLQASTFVCPELSGATGDLAQHMGQGSWDFPLPSNITVQEIRPFSWHTS